MSSPGPHQTRTVVACVLWRFGRLALLQRSALVSSDPGLWHCVSGYVERGADPVAQALTEIFEETGLVLGDMRSFRVGPTIALVGADAVVWRVHTFAVETTRRRLTLDWEHDRYRWVRPSAVAAYQRVPWLERVLSELERTAPVSNEKATPTR